MIKVIFATGLQGQFGRGNSMPWPHIPEDMKHFVTNTKNTTLVMGFNTAEHLPIKATKTRPWIVVTKGRRLKNENEFVEYTTYDKLKTLISDTDLSIIGGASLLTKDILDKADLVYVTYVKHAEEADTFILEETKEWLYWRNNVKPENFIFNNDDIAIVRYYNEEL